MQEPSTIEPNETIPPYDDSKSRLKYYYTRNHKREENLRDAFQNNNLRAIFKKDSEWLAQVESTENADEQFKRLTLSAYYSMENNVPLSEAFSALDSWNKIYNNDEDCDLDKAWENARAKFQPLDGAKKDKGVIGGTWDAVRSGVYRQGATVYNTMGEVGNLALKYGSTTQIALQVAAKFTDNKAVNGAVNVMDAAGNTFRGQARELANYANTQASKWSPVADNWATYSGYQQLGTSGVIKHACFSFLESVPEMVTQLGLAAMTGGTSALGYIAVTTGADKYARLDQENPEMSDRMKVANAFATGAINGFFERVTMGIAGFGGKVTQKEVKDGVMAFLLATAKNTGLEGTTEGFEQFGENVTDILTGAYKGELKTSEDYCNALFQGVPESVIVGGMFGAALTPVGWKQNLMNQNMNRQFMLEVQGEREALRKKAEVTDLTPEERAYYNGLNVLGDVGKLSDLTKARGLMIQYEKAKAESRVNEAEKLAEMTDAEKEVYFAKKEEEKTKLFKILPHNPQDTTAEVEKQMNALKFQNIAYRVYENSESIPAEIKSDLEAQGRDVNAVEAWFDGQTGTVHFVASKIAPHNVQAKINHELLTHKGLRALMEDETLNTFLDAQYAIYQKSEKNRAHLNYVARKYPNIDMERIKDRRKIMEEVLAERAEFGGEDPVLYARRHHGEIRLFAAENNLPMSTPQERFRATQMFAAAQHDTKLATDFVKETVSTFKSVLRKVPCFRGLPLTDNEAAGLFARNIRALRRGKDTNVPTNGKFYHVPPPYRAENAPNTAEAKNQLRDGNVPHTENFLTKNHLEGTRLYADYEFLLGKHPEYLKDAEMARAAVEFVLNQPTYAGEMAEGENLSFIRKDETTGETWRIEIQKKAKAKSNHIRSVHKISENKLKEIEVNNQSRRFDDPSQNSGPKETSGDEQGKSVIDFYRKDTSESEKYKSETKKSEKNIETERSSAEIEVKDYADISETEEASLEFVAEAIKEVWENEYFRVRFKTFDDAIMITTALLNEIGELTDQRMRAIEYFKNSKEDKKGMVLHYLKGENKSIRFSLNDAGETLMRVKGSETEQTVESIINDPNIKAHDFILYADGQDVWGTITPEMAEAGKAFNLEVLPIKLQRGEHFGKHSGYGLAHFVAQHGDEFKRQKIDLNTFLSRIFGNPNKIHAGFSNRGNIRLEFVTKSRPRNIGIIELQKENDYYSIVTVYTLDNSYYKERGKLIWRASEPSDARTKQQSALLEPLAANNVAGRARLVRSKSTNNIDVENENSTLETKKSEEKSLLYSIIGESGASRMADAENKLANLSTARAMLDAGKEMKAIKLATGWERGGDGKWRTEIPDGTFVENPKLQEHTSQGDVYYTAELGDIYNAPVLFESYPELAEMQIVFQDTKPGVAGLFDGEKIVLSSRIDGLGNDANKVLIHEIQHAIQRIEGFATGGNPAVAPKKSKEEIARERCASLIKGIVGLEDEFGNPYTYESAAEWLFNDSLSDFDINDPYKETEYSDVESGAFEFFLRAKNVEEAVEHYIQVSQQPVINAGEWYHRLGGEVEARNAAKRTDIPIEERMQKLLSETEDVAELDKIYLQNALSGTQNSYRFSLNDAGETLMRVKGSETEQTVESIINDPNIKAHDFILYADGQDVWGTITPEMAEAGKALGLKAMPIKLVRGEHFAIHKGYGLKHIYKAHGEYFKNIKQDLNEVLDFIFNKREKIYASNKDGIVRLEFTTKSKPQLIGVLELKESKGFYTIITAFDRNFENYKLKGNQIWQYSKPLETSDNQRTGLLEPLAPGKVEGGARETGAKSTNNIDVENEISTLETKKSGNFFSIEQGNVWGVGDADAPLAFKDRFTDSEWERMVTMLKPHVKAWADINEKNILNYAKAQNLPITNEDEAHKIGYWVKAIKEQEARKRAHERRDKWLEENVPMWNYWMRYTDGAPKVLVPGERFAGEDFAGTFIAKEYRKRSGAKTDTAQESRDKDAQRRKRAAAKGGEARVNLDDFVRFIVQEEGVGDRDTVAIEEDVIHFFRDLTKRDLYRMYSEHKRELNAERVMAERDARDAYNESIHTMRQQMAESILSGGMPVTPEFLESSIDALKSAELAYAHLTGHEIRDGKEVMPDGKLRKLDWEAFNQAVVRGNGDVEGYRAVREQERARYMDEMRGLMDALNAKRTEGLELQRMAVEFSTKYLPENLRSKFTRKILNLLDYSTEPTKKYPSGKRMAMFRELVSEMKLLGETTHKNAKLKALDMRLNQLGRRIDTGMRAVGIRDEVTQKKIDRIREIRKMNGEEIENERARYLSELEQANDLEKDVVADFVSLDSKNDPELQLAMFNIFGNLDRRSASDVNRAYNELTRLAHDGRMNVEQDLEAYRNKLKFLREHLVDLATHGEGLKSGNARIQELNKRKGWLFESFWNSHRFGTQLEMMFGEKGKTKGDLFVYEDERRVFRAEQDEMTRIRNRNTNLVDAAKKIFGVNSLYKVERIMNALHQYEESPVLRLRYDANKTVKDCPKSKFLKTTWTVKEAERYLKNYEKSKNKQTEKPDDTVWEDGEKIVPETYGTALPYVEGKKWGKEINALAKTYTGKTLHNTETGLDILITGKDADKIGDGLKDSTGTPAFIFAKAVNSLPELFEKAVLDYTHGNRAESERDVEKVLRFRTILKHKNKGHEEKYSVKLTVQQYKSQDNALHAMRLLKLDIIKEANEAGAEKMASTAGSPKTPSPWNTITLSHLREKVKSEKEKYSKKLQKDLDNVSTDFIAEQLSLQLAMRDRKQKSGDYTVYNDGVSDTLATMLRREIDAEAQLNKELDNPDRKEKEDTVFSYIPNLKMFNSENMYMTKAEGLNYWLHWQQEDVRAKMWLNGWTDASIKSLEAWLGTDVLKLGEYMRGELDKMRPDLNSVYEKLYYTSMPSIKNYWPAAYDGRPVNIGNSNGVELDQTGNTEGALGYSPGALKVRSFHTLEPRQVDAIQAFMNHTDQMIHFVTHGETVKHLRSVYASQSVSEAVKQVHGVKAYNALKESIRDIINGGNTRALSDSAYSYLLGNWAKIKMALNMSSSVKQLFGQLAYMHDISPKAYASGLVDFFRHPLKAMEIMAENDYFKNRLGGSFDRDVKSAMKRDFARLGVLNSIDRKANEYSFWMLKYGDAVSVAMGGYAVYKYHLEKLTARGVPEAEAHAMALEEAQMSTERTQQSGAVSMMNRWQKGNVMEKMFTSFLSNPILMWQSMSADFYTGLKLKDRKAIMRGAWKMVVTAGIIDVLMTAISQAFQHGVDFDEYEWDDFLWNALVANFSGASGILAMTAEAVTQGLAGGFSKKVPVVDDIATTFNTLKKAGKKVADGTPEEITLREVEKVLQGVGLVNNQSAFAGALLKQVNRARRILGFKDDPKKKLKIAW